MMESTIMDNDKPKAEPKYEPIAKPFTKAKRKDKLEPLLQVETGVKPVLQVYVKPESQVDIKPAPKPRTKRKPLVNPEPLVNPNVNPPADPDAQPAVEPNVKPEPKRKRKPNVKVVEQNPVADPNAKSVVDTNVKIELSVDELKVAKPLLLNDEKTLNEHLQLLEYLLKVTLKSSWCDFYLWKQYGMIINNMTGGSPLGCDLWDKHSKNRPKYKPGECAAMWKTFKDEKKGYPILLQRLRYDNNKMYGELMRLSFGHTDELLLRNPKLEINIREDRKYICATDEILGHIVKDVPIFIVLHNPTGNGKTKTTQDIAMHCLTLGYKGILSIITKRAMSSTHMTSLSKLGLTSYLEGEKNMKRYICSLERVKNLDIFDKDNNVMYDILILDELTSILFHYYSGTMSSCSAMAFLTMDTLIKKAKVIISGDAMITDMALNFVRTFDGHKKLYYRNVFKNKTGAVFCVNDMNKPASEDKKLDLICVKILETYGINKSVMVMSDSRKIVNKLFVRLESQVGKENLILYTSMDCPDNLKQCNETWLNKIVLFSPKIIYGLDCTIKYNSIYAIYKGDTINSFHMIQQISRARHVQRVEAYYMRIKYTETPNISIKFETNVKHQKELMETFMTTGKIEAPKGAKAHFERMVQMNISCCEKFKDIHYHKTWLDSILGRNGSQLVISFCEEQGYTIEYKTVDV